MNDIMKDLQPLIDKSPELVVTYGMKLIAALAVYLIGKWVVSTLANVMQRTIVARGVDATVASFTKNIVYYALITMVVIAALGQLGVKTASFIAVVGAAGLAVGFALQGSLSNFASGVLIILFRPLQIGDYVEAGGASGTVTEISIFQTILKTPDNKTVVVSNSAITGGNIVNYSKEATRRVDFTVGVSYGADIKQVKDVLKKLAEADERVLKDKDVVIGVSELADSSVNFVFRVWVESANYWPIYFDLNEKIKLTFDEQGIEIPFPQMDVHVSKESAA